MPIYPGPDQIQALLASPVKGPIEMLNLLKFKDRAAYDDGRETSLSGREAYDLYARKMVPFVESRGGSVRYTGAAQHLVIGEGDLAWDAVAIVQYPSLAEFVKVAQAPEVAEFAVHRAAGLAFQLLVACTEGSP